MSCLQRQNETFKEIIKNSSIRLLYPQCLRGFPCSDSLYRHFREQQDDIHEGLGIRDRGHNTFLSCYQAALRAPIPSIELPIGPQCFEVLFIDEYYGEDAEEHPYMPPITTSYSGPTAGRYVFYECIQYTDRKRSNACIHWVSTSWAWFILSCWFFVCSFWSPIARRKRHRGMEQLVAWQFWWYYLKWVLGSKTISGTNYLLRWSDPPRFVLRIFWLKTTAANWKNFPEWWWPNAFRECHVSCAELLH